MRIENKAQEGAVIGWIERVCRHLVSLQAVGKKSPTPVEDQIEISRRLRDYLESCLISYREENYATQRETTNSQSKDQTAKESEGGLRWDYDSPTATPERYHSGSQEPLAEVEAKAEVNDDLSSENTQPEESTEEDAISKEGS